MSPNYKDNYRRIRNMWGWVLAGAWVVFWYFSLNSHGAGECESMLASAGCSLTAGFGLILALLTAPLAFVVSHYIARTLVEREERSDQKRDAQDRRQQQAKLAEMQDQQLRAIQQQDAAAQRAMDRKVFIQKLGTARDALSAQGLETDPARLALAAQQVSAALRDLATRFPLGEMTFLINGDAALELLVRTLIDDLRNSMQFPPEARLLEQALGPVTPGSRPAPGPLPTPRASSKYRMP